MSEKPTQFDEIAKTCPWIGEAGECLALYHMPIGNYPLCCQEVCGFWYWLNIPIRTTPELKEFKAPSMETMLKAFDQVADKENNEKKS